VKTTGDGILIEFPSVVDAIRCAIEVQQGMVERNVDVPQEQRIEFRVGVNLGDVMIEGRDLYGDGVNIAARLEALAEPGGICISRTVLSHARDKVPFEVEDAGEQALKNIARPVHVYRIIIDRSRRSAAPKLEIPALALPDKPSVAVLPFTNMSGDPEQEFVSDGIAEDVITALSHYPSLFVIARNSSFTYKGRAVDVKQVGRELGVRYVLEGSVRKAGNRIRVTAQLIEAVTSNHVWAERYDRDLADIFAVQDELTEALTTALAPAIADAELRRAMRKPPESLDAWAAYQRGLWHLSKATPDDDATAERFFKQAIDLDPTFAGGYSALALYQLQAAAIYQKLGLASARRRRRCVGGDRASSLNESKSGHRAWPQRCDADLRGTTKGRARGSRNMYQARSPRSVSGGAFVARRVRTIFLQRIRGFDRSRETADPFVSRFSDDLPLARGGAGPTWAHNGSEGCIGEGRLARTGGIRHVCPQESSVVSSRGPRSSRRGLAQGRLEWLRPH
jgi:adenylate cyclase